MDNHQYARYDSFSDDKQHGYVFPPAPPPHAANHDNERMNPVFTGRPGRSGYQHRRSYRPTPSLETVGYMPPRYQSPRLQQHLPHQSAMPSDRPKNTDCPPHLQRPSHHQDYNDSMPQHYFQHESDSFANTAFTSNERGFRGNSSRPFSVRRRFFKDQYMI